MKVNISEIRSGLAERLEKTSQQDNTMFDGDWYRESTGLFNDRKQNPRNPMNLLQQQADWMGYGYGQQTPWDILNMFTLGQQGQGYGR